MNTEMTKLAVAVAKVLGKIIAVIGGKGGSLKSTTTQNLGVALTSQGKKVLIIDFNVRLDVKETIKSCGAITAKVFSVVIDMNEKQNAKGIAPRLLANVADTMPIAPVKLYKRSSWLEVKYSGLGVVEAKKDKIATQQFLDLADFVTYEINNAKAA